MSSDEIVIDIKNLSKRYEIYATPRDRLKQLVLPHLYQVANRIGRMFWRKDNITRRYFREFWALKDVSFNVRKGETVGIIGLNGSGKSTLLQLICNTLNPTYGNVQIKGRVAALLELGSGFNPEFTGRENVFLNGQVLGLTREEIQDRFRAIEEFADIGYFIDQPVKTYSSGMVVRLAFAVAINVDPEVLVVDEALAVGDLAFQRKCMRWMEDFAGRRGILLFVSHSPEQVRRLCTKAVYLRHGAIAGLGPAKEICEKYEKDQHIKLVTEDQNFCSQTNNDSIDIEIKSDDQIDASVFGFPDCALHYGDERARITGAWLEDSYGLVRNSFQVGEVFTWCYRVEFFCVDDAITFGFLIKTKEGISLFGTNSVMLGCDDYSVNPGSSTVVRFIIEPNLGPGEYFINCGVSIESSGKSEFLHRVIDAGIVVISEKESSGAAIVNMNVKMHLSGQVRH